MNTRSLDCSDCAGTNVSRRDFLKASAGIAAVSAIPTWAAPSPGTKSETLVATLSQIAQ